MGQVAERPAHITKADIDSLDTTRLTEALLKSRYLLTSALLEHADHENHRLFNLRNALNLLEGELLDEDKLKALPIPWQLEIYKQVSSNANKSFDSIMKLGSSMDTSIDTVSKIDTTKKILNNDAFFNRRDPAVEDLMKKITDELSSREEKK